MITTYFAGFTLGISLIFAIGAQNAFVIKQGLKKEHVFIVCFICAFSDAILISLGVSGFGTIVSQYPQIEQFARYFGAAFLTLYGLKSFYSAWKSNHVMEDSDKEGGQVRAIILTCLAFTWLNPHVYLDTVVLLGSISTQYEGQQLFFALGAVTASFTFFFSLGYGARVLAPLFKKPRSWKIFELLIGIMMLSIAWHLIF